MRKRSGVTAAVLIVLLMVAQSAMAGRYRASGDTTYMFGVATYADMSESYWTGFVNADGEPQFHPTGWWCPIGGYDAGPEFGPCMARDYVALWTRAEIARIGSFTRVITVEQP